MSTTATIDTIARQVAKARDWANLTQEAATAADKAHTDAQNAQKELEQQLWDETEHVVAAKSAELAAEAEATA